MHYIHGSAAIGHDDRPDAQVSRLYTTSRTEEIPMLVDLFARRRDLQLAERHRFRALQADLNRSCTKTVGELLELVGFTGNRADGSGCQSYSSLQ